MQGHQSEQQQQTHLQKQGSATGLHATVNRKSRSISCMPLLLLSAFLTLPLLPCCRQDQAFQQGGMFVFDGTKCVWSHYDQATGAHADLSEVLGVATDLGQLAAATTKDCGCSQE